MSNVTKSRKEVVTMWQLCLALAISGAAAMLPDLVYATAQDTPIGDIFCNIAALATGNTGKGLATIAITVIGLGALLGKVSWGMALIVALGIALVFGAAAIAGSIGVTNMETGCNTTATWPSR